MLVPRKRCHHPHFLKSAESAADERITGAGQGCAANAIPLEEFSESLDSLLLVDGWTNMPLTAYSTLLRLITRQTVRRSRQYSARIALLLAVSASGCVTTPRTWQKTVGNDTTDVDQVTSEIDNPAPAVFHEASYSAAPITAEYVSEADVNYVDRTLDDVLREALQHSSVLRDIGGVILRAPDTIRTVLAPRIQESDPRYGMEASLSAFDAQLAATAMFNSNNRIYNNPITAGGTAAFMQDLNDYQVELSKRTATGSVLSVRGVNNYDSNNAAANTFYSSWNSWVEGEVRQPLLQGAGLEFNRIAGPGSTPGVYNGILIAKANADINQHDFTIALTDFISNVENAYWDLYLSYRELDARKKAMEQALVIWNEARELERKGSIKAAEEALARQQYYQLKSEVDEVLSGRILPGTQVRNGATGGTLQSGGGVLAAERRLRLLCGLPASDGSLIRPSEEPTMAHISFDWESSLYEAMTLRPEIQKQNISLKKRELELLAARNFVNPRLDAVGRYRVRGFGHDLIAGGNQTGTAPASSIGNLATTDHQEWMLGVEYTVPIGYRKAHAAVDHAELMVARERMIMKEQQREIVSHLSGAVADVARAFQAVQNNLNQYLAAQNYFSALENQKHEQGMEVEPDRLLDAQRRLVNAEIQFFRARAEYAVSLKNFQYEKGALLLYKDLRIAGAGPPPESFPAVDQRILDEALPPAQELKGEVPSNAASEKSSSPKSGSKSPILKLASAAATSEQEPELKVGDTSPIP
jgi:outer membrane protein TolC